MTVLLTNVDRNGTVELCQGNLQCIFDYQLTGKESIGQATKQFSDRFEAVIREIAPGNVNDSEPRICRGNEDSLGNENRKSWNKIPSKANKSKSILFSMKIKMNDL